MTKPGKPGDTVRTLAEALRLVLPHIEVTVRSEWVPLARARDRILSSELVAAADLPPRDNAAMDGYVVQSADLATHAKSGFRIVGRAAAGHPFEGVPAPGEAVQILTGAPIPAGTDTVVMQESCLTDGLSLRIVGEAKPKAHCRCQGEDVSARLDRFSNRSTASFDGHRAGGGAGLSRIARLQPDAGGSLLDG